jgi:DNA-binding transcriptional ArsR family regulator
MADPKAILGEVAHPVRAGILDVLSRRVTTPSEVAEELGVSVGVVSYHVRQLKGRGLIRLVRTEPRRGAVKHFYAGGRLLRNGRLSISYNEWQNVPEAIRRGIAAAVVRELKARVNATARARAGRPRSTEQLLGPGWETISSDLATLLQLYSDAEAQGADTQDRP